ncbi:MAG TPA: 50S ribosomal protein L32 [Pseudonocardiaceae bacterium]|nr:50S ribosomal protein L32 [Pseudonocardiaceae bacterium]
MAVPKRRMSRSNTRSRRAQWKATAPTLAACSNRACRQPKPPHVACPHCGKYDGRQIVRPA